MGVMTAASASTSTVPVLGECGKCREARHRHQSKNKFKFHVSSSSLRRLSGTQHLAYVETQIEGKAVQIEGGAPGETQFHPPQRSRFKCNPAVETVFPGQVGSAGDGVVVKSIVAFSFA